MAGRQIIRGRIKRFATELYQNPGARRLQDAQANSGIEYFPNVRFPPLVTNAAFTKIVVEGHFRLKDRY